MSLSDRSILPSFAGQYRGSTRCAGGAVEASTARGRIRRLPCVDPAGQRADPPDPPLLQLQRDPRRRRLVRARAEDDDFAIARDRFERTLEI